MSDRTNVELAKSRLSMTALLKLEAPDWRTKNPVRDDKHGNSFSLTPEDHGWNDNATGAKGDQIALMELARTVNELRRDLEKVKAEVKVLIDERDLRRRIK